MFIIELPTKGLYMYVNICHYNVYVHISCYIYLQAISFKS